MEETQISQSEDPLPTSYLNKIELKDKQTFQQFLPKDALISDHTFASVFMWRNAIKLYWNIHSDCLCIYANGDGGLTLLSAPSGNGDRYKALNQAIEVCNDYNKKTKYQQPMRVEYVDNNSLDLVKHLNIESMSGDYVYETSRMIDLEGRDLASKRQAKNRFMRRFPNFSLVDYDKDSHYDSCLTLLSLWNNQGIEEMKYENSIEIKRNKELESTIECLKYSKELNLKGMVLFDASTLVGFTFGEQLSNDTCSILAEKVNREYVGGANFIFAEFCKQHWSHTKYTNVGDDWDVPSLAWTKESYRPIKREQKWMAKV